MKKFNLLIISFILTLVNVNAIADCDIDGSKTVVRRDTTGGFMLNDRVTRATIQIDLADCEDNNPTSQMAYNLVLSKEFGAQTWIYRNGWSQLTAKNNIKHTFYQLASQKTKTGDDVYKVCLHYYHENEGPIIADCDYVDLGID